MPRNTIIQPATLNADPVKAAAVEQERARLMDLFAGADPNKLDFIRDAVQQVAWLGITIAELQRDIDERGPVVPFQNGKNQEGLQANPAAKLLKDFQQLHNTLFRALLPVLPDKPRGLGKLGEFCQEFDELAPYRPDSTLPLNIDDV